MEELFKDLVEEENGEYKGLDQLVVETGCDSFGVTMVLLGVNEKYKFFEEFKDLEIETLTFNKIKELCDVYK